jgi:hypothetical protein
VTHAMEQLAHPPGAAHSFPECFLEFTEVLKDCPRSWPVIWPGMRLASPRVYDSLVVLGASRDQDDLDMRGLRVLA